MIGLVILSLKKNSPGQVSTPSSSILEFFFPLNFPFIISSYIPQKNLVKSANTRICGIPLYLMFAKVDKQQQAIDTYMHKFYILEK